MLAEARVNKGNVREHRILARLAWNLAANEVRTLYRHSLLKIVFCLLMLLSFVVGAYALFRSGFQFLGTFSVLGGFLADRFLYIFSYCLFLMLTASAVVTSYIVLYKSEDNPLLLTLPISWEALWSKKSLEVFVLSAWAVMFLAVPFVAAYGEFKKVGMSFYGFSLLCFVFLSWIACATGALSVSVFFLVFRKRVVRKWVLRVLIALSVVLFAFLGRETLAEETTDSPITFFNQLLPQFKVSFDPLFPHAWASEAIHACIKKQPARSAFYACLLLSNALFLFQIGFVLARPLYRTSFAVVTESQGQGSKKKRSWLLERLLRCIPGLRASGRALVLKDLVLFVRDPMQWSQFLIFFGILGIYFANLRSLRYDLLSAYWKSIVFMINLSSLLVTLASLNGRFVFPMFSLEGNRFWIVGLSPVSMRSLLVEKFCLAAFFNLALMSVLTALAAWMMRVPFLMAVYSLVLTGLASVVLAALAVGLGAIFPDFKTDNPVRILSGFGGTLTFVLELVYVVILLASFSSFMSMSAFFHDAYFYMRGLAWLAPVSVLFAASAIFGALPLWLATRRLEALEY